MTFRSCYGSQVNVLEVNMNETTRKALVIDDDPGVRNYISELLVGEGFDVWEAPDGAIGITMIEEIKNLDLIVTDILMPNTDGVEVLMALRKTRKESSPNAKVIAISGGGLYLEASAFLADIRKLGADGVLMKPFSLDNLRATLASLGLQVGLPRPSHPEIRH